MMIITIFISPYQLILINTLVTPHAVPLHPQKMLVYLQKGILFSLDDAISVFIMCIQSKLYVSTVSENSRSYVKYQATLSQTPTMGRLILLTD